MIKIINLNKQLKNYIKNNKINLTGLLRETIKNKENKAEIINNSIKNNNIRTSVNLEQEHYTWFKNNNINIRLLITNLINEKIKKNEFSIEFKQLNKELENFKLLKKSIKILINTLYPNNALYPEGLQKINEELKKSSVPDLSKFKNFALRNKKINVSNKNMSVSNKNRSISKEKYRKEQAEIWNRI